MKYCTVCKAKYDDGVSFCPVDGEVLEDDPSSIVGTVLDGQYQIEALLGKGGMGAVFRANHILLGDRVAIKVLPPEMRNNAEWLRRFRREGQAARRFRHSNAVTVYDLRTAADGTIYMVMEYVEGHTLDAELRIRGRLTPAETFALLEPIMSVLDAAHSMGVVHRDLKPENIMIGKAGPGGERNIKLLDLGIAKLRDVAGAGTGGGNTALTMAGQMLGTPYYMSPEQWGELPRDGNEEIDGRADIYSLGLVFYEMIAGRRPYSALTLLELRREHVAVTPRRLDEVAPNVSRQFSDVIARSMAKDRADRPATTGELATELKAALMTGENDPAQFFPRPDTAKAVSSNSPAATGSVIKASQTVSDVNAATILAMDAMARDRSAAPQQVAAATPSAELQSAARTVAESADGSFSVSPAVPRAPVTQAAAPDYRSSQPALPVGLPATPAPRRGSIALVIGGLLVVILLVLVVGGIFLIQSLRTPESRVAGPAAKISPASETVAADKEVARYWLEVVGNNRNDTRAQVVPMIPIASGSYFKFHFTPSQDGYLYIVGPNEHNKTTTFLTANPSPDATGLSTNAVKEAVSLSVPTGSLANGEERWFQLDQKPGTETYTLIFSPTPLKSAQVFEGKIGHELTAAEQAEVNSLREKYQSGGPQYSDSNTGSPFVSVKANGAASGNPLVIDVRIEHK
jgi:serine/threonine protein kinase